MVWMLMVVDYYWCGVVIISCTLLYSHMHLGGIFHVREHISPCAWTCCVVCVGMLCCVRGQISPSAWDVLLTAAKLMHLAETTKRECGTEAESTRKRKAHGRRGVNGTEGRQNKGRC